MRLEQCINGEYENQIAPFFWQHGDSKQELLRVIETIQSAHMDVFCVESRTHEEFGYEKWWDDFAFILEEAKRRDMKVWLLDDKHFPSGFANNYLVKHPELVRRMIREQHVDMVGPQKQMSLLADHCENGEKLLYVFAYPRSEDGRIIADSYVNLTGKVQDGLLLWDVPQGYWRVFYLIETTAVVAAKDDSRYYIDMMSEESCEAMIKAVYEPHYERFCSYFGTTFLGFFSDEPCLSNEKGTYYSTLGRREVPLPWNSCLLEVIAEKEKVSLEQAAAMLPGLWQELASDTDVIRYAYMDAVSRRYQDCFSRLLGDWCREHGAKYIGHVIEDMNTHMRLGYGCGHFFRAMDGQDMSGADVVLHQIVPGLQDMTHHALIADCGIADPEFFDYTLAKLAVSASHIDAKKKNRCMCEMFGAYGWAEGLPMMKYLADHMLVNGVNYFVPHAFTNRYPNEDCPPHFWADGTNPQFTYFGDLVDYMNRCVHLLADSVHCADVAVFYNAEAEWCAGETMLFQKICKQLTQNQIDFDIVPQDTLRENAKVKGERLWIGEESYGALLISYSERLPHSLMELFYDLAKAGLPILFADALPTYGMPEEPLPEQMTAVAFTELSGYLRASGLCSFEVKDQSSKPRFYHVKREKEHVMMFFNDNIFTDIESEIQLPFAGELVWYDPWTQACIREYTEDGKVVLKLPRCNTIFVMTSEEKDENLLMRQEEKQKVIRPELIFDIYVQEPDQEEGYYAKGTQLCNLSAPDRMPHFCGKIRYQTKFEILSGQKIQGLDLGVVGETAEVFVNGISCGLRIQAPYRFDIAKAVKAGENMMEVIVTNNPAYRERDRFSRMLALPPSGLLGEVVFLQKIN